MSHKRERERKREREKERERGDQSAQKKGFNKTSEFELYVHIFGMF